MAYAVNNQAVFIAAYCGAMAGMSASNRYVTDVTVFSGIANVAGAYAQAIDTLWGVNPSSSVQNFNIQESSESVWQNRAPQPSSETLDPNTYFDLAAAVILSVNASQAYFVAEGINPNLPSGGGVPPVSGISGATIVERPGGNRISARLTQSEIDPSIAITSWTKTAPNGAENIYRRGDSIAGVTASAVYNVSGPPSVASVVDTYANGAADSGGGLWSAVAPFAAWSRSAAVVGPGVDANPDPQWTATLNATGDIVATAAINTFFSSDIYIGTSANPLVVGTDVYNVVLQPGFSDVIDGATGKPLKRVRQAGSGTGFPPYAYVIGAPLYAYVLWPDQAQYTSGTILFFNDDTGFAVPMTQIANTTITRNGVVRTYEVWRTSALQGSNFNLRVT